MQQVTVYIKEDCHLCDSMLKQIEDCRLQPDPAIRFRLEVRDIEERADWYQRFREYVPVVVINGVEVCHYFFDPQEFESALSCH